MTTAAPIAHRSDPWTSHAAAREITASGAREALKARVVAMVARYPASTAGELAGAMGDVDRVQVARRLTDAKHDGLVTQGPARRCTVGGKACVTWLPVEKQGELW